MTLRLIPAAQLGLVNDPDPARDELPAREAFEVIDSCANCAANEATVGALRAEVVRLREENASLRSRHDAADDAFCEAIREQALRAERRALLPNAAPQDDLGLRAAILEADE